VSAGGAAEHAHLAGSRETWLGHPRGLFLLFFVEMWERFSYYGMRSLLVLYLVAPALTGGDGADGALNPGRGWSRADASLLYGWYTGLAYLLPIAGGWLADNLLGTHRSMIVGGTVIALGHVVLAVSGLGSLAHDAAGMSVFVFGLALVVIGTGHFKPCVSVMVGQLYDAGDPRRDGAFTIFYMGINLGAFLAAFVCGTLGERVGWHWGFGAAAVGMIAGLLAYVGARDRYLPGIGAAPVARDRSAGVGAAGVALAAAFALLFHSGALGTVAGLVSGGIVAALFGLLALGWVVWFLAQLSPAERGPTVTLLVFMLFNAVFWLAFEQAGSSLNLFTDTHTDRTLGGFTVPTTWFQSINATFIILLAPLFAALWSWLGRRERDPGQSVKIALGLLFLAVGYACTTWAGAIAAGAGVKAPMMLIVATYFWHTVGELCLSPTGLAYVTRAAPARFVSLLMGVWLVSTFLANLGGGLVAAQVEAIERGEITLPWDLGGQADFFALFVVSAAGAGVLLLGIAPLLRRLAPRLA
jgi:POT family proton-dependent oligopeptide transporter